MNTGGFVLVLSYLQWLQLIHSYTAGTDSVRELLHRWYEIVLVRRL